MRPPSRGSSSVQGSHPDTRAYREFSVGFCVGRRGDLPLVLVPVSILLPAQSSAQSPRVLEAEGQPEAALPSAVDDGREYGRVRKDWRFDDARGPGFGQGAWMRLARSR